MSDKRVLTISAIVLVAVIMGMSAVAPMIPQAEAEHADTACDKLKELFDGGNGPLKTKAWDKLKGPVCHIP